MDKTELIRQVMAEVQDPALRDALLREIVEKGKPDAAEPSLILRELDALGANVEGVKDYSRFHLKVARIVGYLGGLNNQVQHPDKVLRWEDITNN